MFKRGRFLAAWPLALLCAALPWAKSSDKSVPMATDDWVQLSGWWPTKGTYPRDQFLGPEACKACHASKFNSQSQTPMAQALARPQDSPPLRSQEQLTFRSDPFLYQISRQAQASVYSVSEGTQSLSAPLDWAFGFGESGQTFVLNHEGKFYESRVSFFRALDGLDFTPGQAESRPSTVDAAVGRVMPPSEGPKCFGCHSTAATANGHFDTSRMILGVTCEACHGPGEKHVAAMKTKQTKPGMAAIFDPGKLNPTNQVDFCGACHRTYADVILAQIDGIRNVRFQPYRLEKSQCWIKSDNGVTCLACHNPHQARMKDDSAYDDVCTGCHRAGGARSAKTCPVAKTQCVSCHMPKYQMPGMHYEFTDHFIRIVKKGETYPD